MKRSLPDIADLTPADMPFTQKECTGDPSLSWQEWQTAWWAFLGENLVQTVKYFSVDPSAGPDSVVQPDDSESGSF